MLNNEEKKTIKNIKKEFEKNHILPDIANEDLGILLNLIEKQSKEIEEYKKQLDLDYVDKHFVPIERYNQLEKEIEELNKSDASKEQSSMYYYNLYKELVDKIKAKIEELDYNDIGNFERRCKQEVLQSLLEKE